MIEVNFINTLIILILSPILFLAYYTLVILNLKRKYRHLPGPEAKGITGFFFGFSKDIGECYAKGELFEDKLIEWEKIYGPVFKIQLESEIRVFTTDKTALKEIFFTKKFPLPEKTYKSFMFPYSIRTFGSGLSTEFNHEKWHHRRMILNQGFNRNILMSMMTQFNVKIDLLMEKLSKQAFEKKSISFNEEFSKAIFDLISLVLFSFDEDVDNINMNEKYSFTNLVNEVMEISFRHSVDKFAEISPFKIKDRLRLKKITKLLRQKPKELIMERMKNLDNNTKDMLNLIIDACKGQENDDESLMELMIDDFFTFFTGGVDSSVKLLKSCIKFLEKNTNALEKAKKEIEEVIGSRTQINYDDLGKLKYCSSIVKETLRIEPVFQSLARNIDSDFTICGLNIPKGTDIWVSPYVSGRMESHFQNPNEFKPERFMTDTDSMDTRIDPVTYFPFGLGPRGCIGKTFVHIESVTLLVKLLQRFDFKTDQSNTSYEPHYILTSRE